MIVKRNFNLRSVCWYIRYECLASLAWSMAVYGTYRLFDLSLHLPFSVAGILGSALAIFIAFRNQSSYARWWEARTIWGGIVNNSRILARQMIANVNQAIATGKVTEPEGARYKKEMIDRQIAFAHALRLHLRKETAWDVLQPFLTETEYRFVQHTSNRPNTLLLQQGIRIREAMQLEFLGAFDNISLEPNLAAFNNWQGAC
ncbi:MAG TPA: bestrophin family ion channel, partial [Ferruginibacter sp.]|nr:bestrophin family ion channel [Ferruginibacter sp.]